GTLTGAITITDSAPGSPQMVLLMGNPPPVSLSSTSLTYASQLVGTSSSAQAVTLTNPGNVPVNISEIGVGGPNSSDFAENNTCGNALAAGASCSISLIFRPTTRGSRVATVTVFDDATNSPQILSLTGTGILPIVSQ